MKYYSEMLSDKAGKPVLFDTEAELAKAEKAEAEARKKADEEEARRRKELEASLERLRLAKKAYAEARDRLKEAEDDYSKRAYGKGPRATLDDLFDCGTGWFTLL